MIFARFIKKKKREIKSSKNDLKLNTDDSKNTILLMQKSLHADWFGSKIMKPYSYELDIFLAKSYELDITDL